MTRYWKAQWFILLTGSVGFVWVAGHVGTVLVWGRVRSWKVSVEDVISHSASVTGESAVHVLLSSVGGVDVIRVSSVFTLLGVAGTVPVNNTWEREGTFRT